MAKPASRPAAIGARTERLQVCGPALAAPGAHGGGAGDDFATRAGTSVAYVARLAQESFSAG
jgi:hypothetical protein